MPTNESLSERPTFSEGRLSSETVVSELMIATGIPEEVIIERIPELLRRDLAFSTRWADAWYNDSEVGRQNAQAVREFVYVHILDVDVDGKPGVNVNDLNRSFAINSVTGTIAGFKDFYGAGDYLHSEFAMVRITDSGF